MMSKHELFTQYPCTYLKCHNKNLQDQVEIVCFELSRKATEIEHKSAELTYFLRVPNEAHLFKHQLEN